MKRRIRISDADADLRKAFNQMHAALKNAKQDMEVVFRRYNAVKTRSEEHNRTQQMWHKEAGEQGDMTAEEYRGYCKLHFGIQILRAENEDFRESYDRLIRDRDYIEKMEMMMAPLDFPVTRLMTSKQMTQYMNAVQQHYQGLGFVLTIPVDKRYEVAA